MLLLTLIIALIYATNTNLVIIKQETIKKQTLIIQIIYLATNSLIIVALTNRLKNKLYALVSANSSR
jgi:hypothetical protein